MRNAPGTPTACPVVMEFDRRTSFKTRRRTLEASKISSPTAFHCISNDSWASPLFRRRTRTVSKILGHTLMILPQVHLRNSLLVLVCWSRDQHTPQRFPNWLDYILSRAHRSTHFRLVCERSPCLPPEGQTVGASLRIAHFSRGERIRPQFISFLCYRTPWFPTGRQRVSPAGLV
jgi:hypothetical protein